MEREDLTVSLLQFNPSWEDTETNFIKIEKLLSEAHNLADLTLLPEMFNTGFSMNISLAESIDGPSVKQLKAWASNYNTAFVTSLLIKANDGKIFNRLVFVEPEKVDVLHYDKRHLFRMGLENENITAGNQRLQVKYKDWDILPLICYDLRFPVWSRNKEPWYDLLIYVSNWPAARHFVWDTLLKARAIENQCYVIGINRVGKDGNNIDYIGDSLIIDPKGRVIHKLTADEYILTTKLGYNEMYEYRESFPVLKDADDFHIKG